MTNRPSPVRKTKLDGPIGARFGDGHALRHGSCHPGGPDSDPRCADSPRSLDHAVSIRARLHRVLGGDRSLFCFHLGRLADRLGWARSVLISIATSALLLLAISLGARSIASLLPAMLIAGANVALAVPATALAIAKELPTHRQGVTFGAKEAAISLATLLGGLAVPGVALTIGWRWAFVLAVVIPAVAFGLLSIDRPSLTTVQPSDIAGKGREGIDDSLRGTPASFRLLTAGAGFAGASVAGIAGFAVLSAVDAGARRSTGRALDRCCEPRGNVLRDRTRGFGRPSSLRGIPGDKCRARSGCGRIPGDCHQHGPRSHRRDLPRHMFGWAFSGLMHLGAVTAHPHSPASATAILQVGVGIGLTVEPITFGTLVDNSGYSLAWGAMATLALAAAAIFRIGAKRFSRVQPQTS